MNAPSTIRTFDTGATRDADADKPDYEGFLSPLVIEAFGRYMHRHRTQADGTLRDSDNWQKGMPADAYMKSGWRHFLDWWKGHRDDAAAEAIEEACCALLFNVQGYLHETLKHEQWFEAEIASETEAVMADMVGAPIRAGDTVDLEAAATSKIQIGDRVKALGYYLGRVGKVVGRDAAGWLVEFDGWIGGHDGGWEDGARNRLWMAEDHLEVLDRPLQVGDRALLKDVDVDIRSVQHIRTITAAPSGDTVICDCSCGVTGEHRFRSELRRIA